MLPRLQTAVPHAQAVSNPGAPRLSKSHNVESHEEWIRHVEEEELAVLRKAQENTRRQQIRERLLVEHSSLLSCAPPPVHLLSTLQDLLLSRLLHLGGAHTTQSRVESSTGDTPPMREAIFNMGSGKMQDGGCMTPGMSCNNVMQDPYLCSCRYGSNSPRVYRK